MKALMLCLFLGMTWIQSEKPVLSLSQKINFVVVDELENIYVTSNNLLNKFDKNGNISSTYSDKSYPEISAIDFNSSLRPILFYSNVPALVILDNTLSRQGDQINLNHYGLSQVSLFCTSSDNNYWFYNEQNVELIRVNKQLKTQTNSGNLNLILRREIHPIQMQEVNDRVYLLDPEIGLVVFDRFATYIKTIKLAAPFWFSVKNEIIYYQNKSGLHSYDEKNFVDKKINSLNDERAKWVVSNLYLYKVGEFDVSRISKE